MSIFLIVGIFLAVGFLTGILIGMLGIGGGVIFVPALYILLPFLGYDLSTVSYAAIATSLFAGAIASSFSGYFHINSDNVEKRKALLMAAGSALTAFILPFFVVKVEPVTLKIIFAAVLLIVSVKMLFDHDKKRTNKHDKIPSDLYLPVIGTFVGALSAFTGLGGGIVYFPSLYYMYKLDVRKAVGTSSLITAATMISSSLSFLFQSGSSTNSYISIVAGIPLGLGAIVGARIGVGFVLKIKSERVKKIFSFLLIIVIIKIILSVW